MGASGTVMMSKHVDKDVFYAVKLIGSDCIKEAELALTLL
jgi:hypothetical protein